MVLAGFGHLMASIMLVKVEIYSQSKYRGEMQASILSVFSYLLTNNITPPEKRKHIWIFFDAAVGTHLQHNKDCICLYIGRIND